MRAAPAPTEIDFSDVLRLMGDSAANGDNNDPVVFQGRVETQMRALIAKYGFERLPLTYGELAGLMEYCNELDSAAGFGMFSDQRSLRAWQRNSLDTWGEDLPEMLPAKSLYMSGELAALTTVHREQDTLTQLGRRWREFER